MPTFCGAATQRRRTKLGHSPENKAGWVQQGRHEAAWRSYGCGCASNAHCRSREPHRGGLHSRFQHLQRARGDCSNNAGRSAGQEVIGHPRWGASAGRCRGWLRRAGRNSGRGGDTCHGVDRPAAAQVRHCHLTRRGHHPGRPCGTGVRESSGAAVTDHLPPVPALRNMRTTSYHQVEIYPPMDRCDDEAQHAEYKHAYWLARRGPGAVVDVKCTLDEPRGLPNKSAPHNLAAV